MNKKRISALSEFIAAALLFLISAALGLCSQEDNDPDGRWVLVAPLLALIVGYPLIRSRNRPNVRFIHYALMAIPYAFCAREWPVLGHGMLPSINFGFYASLFAQLVGIAQLYQTPSPRRIPLLCACLLMGMSVCGVELSWEIFLPLFGACMAGILLLLRQNLTRPVYAPNVSKRWPNIVIATIFILIFTFSAASTVGAGIMIKHFSIRAQQWLMQRWIVRGGIGFSNNARIGSINTLRNSADNQDISVVVFSNQSPGYLRGKAFWTYNKSEWKEPNEREEELFPDDTIAPLTVLPGRPMPEVGAPADMIVIPSSIYRHNLFMPLSTCAFDFNGAITLRHFGNSISSRRERSSQGYSVYTTPSGVIEAKTDTTDTSIIPPIPSDLVKAIAEVCRQLPVKRGDSSEKIVQAVSGYFFKNYSYRIGIYFSDQGDPLAEFLDLSQHNTGHCELFASAGALILRAYGIKTRYVTGFVCQEHNPYGNMWVARQKDAHAWVEYQDSLGYWHIAEFTPGGAGRAEGDFVEPSPLYDYLKAMARRIWGSLMQRGATGLTDIFLQYLSDLGHWIIDSWYRLTALMVAIAIYLSLTMFSYHRKLMIRYRSRNLHAAIRVLKKEFNRCERRLRRHGLGKGENETLHEYATRLRAFEFPGKEEIIRILAVYERIRYQRTLHVPLRLVEQLPTRARMRFLKTWIASDESEKR